MNNEEKWRINYIHLNLINLSIKKNILQYTKHFYDPRNNFLNWLITSLKVLLKLLTISSKSHHKIRYLKAKNYDTPYTCTLCKEENSQ